ncbi:LOW QUALITY PROTEIN: coagulation factor XI-like [Mya arenaria]|uniref:LOW QUALITY PROTEIN: coagulation factor XI-like n=1 Tax=Mya arenaria TaxID=6604 RepID=UPI0022E2B630|nr:LOW QUALITY PROTEIN: coagulation factor XI-like [Mya arenaria]
MMKLKTVSGNVTANFCTITLCLLAAMVSLLPPVALVCLTSDIKQSENGSLTSQEGPQSVYNPDNLLTNVFHPWTAWSECNRKCHQTRKRHCKKPRHCGKSYIKEKQNCFGDLCQTKKVSKNRMKLLRLRKNGKFVKQILYKYLYGTWTKWTVCSRNCMKERYRKCKQPAMCGDSFIQEERQCRRATLTCRKQYVLRTFVTVNELSKPKGDKLEEEIKKIVNVSGTPHLPGENRKNMKSSVLSNLASTCGLRAMEGSYRIVQGHEARKHAWPWQISILEKTEEQFCGGTLIAPQWVLTAAHCVRKKKRKRKIFVRVGDHHIFEHDKGEKKMKIEDFVHPRYNYNTITNDIALLKLEKPMAPSDTVGFACLPNKGDAIEKRIKKADHSELCYIIGWGKAKSTDLYGSTRLLEAQIPLVDRDTCQKAFDYVIHRTQLCAGSRRGGVDSCAGDSGGPLLCARKTENPNGVSKNRWTVYGVTSYGEGCGEKKKYGIYTNVRRYLDWITETIETNS